MELGIFSFVHVHIIIVKSINEASNRISAFNLPFHSVAQHHYALGWTATGTHQFHYCSKNITVHGSKETYFSLNISFSIDSCSLHSSNPNQRASVLPTVVCQSSRSREKRACFVSSKPEGSSPVKFLYWLSIYLVLLIKKCKTWKEERTKVWEWYLLFYKSRLQANNWTQHLFFSFLKNYFFIDI